MNYWLAEPAGLGETVLPLINLIDMVRTPGSGTGTRVAQEYYGARGFVIHHNTDIWGDAEPIDGYQWGIWPMGGAWLSLHAWDHYAYTLDKSFCMIARGPFCTVPRNSSSTIWSTTVRVTWSPVRRYLPENSYRLPDGSHHSLAMGPTMDIEIVHELFTRTLDAGKILGEDAAFLKQVEDACSKLPPFDRQVRPAAGVAARLRRSRAGPSPHLASLGALPRHPNLS